MLISTHSLESIFDEHMAEKNSFWLWYEALWNIFLLLLSCLLKVSSSLSRVEFFSINFHSSRADSSIPWLRIAIRGIFSAEFSSKQSWRTSLRADSVFKILFISFADKIVEHIFLGVRDYRPDFPGLYLALLHDRNDDFFIFYFKKERARFSLWENLFCSSFVAR